MRGTRNAFLSAQKKESEIFNLIDDTFGRIDLQHVPTEAENSENLHEAISCYLQYGEYDIDSIWNELIAGSSSQEECIDEI